MREYLGVLGAKTDPGEKTASYQRQKLPLGTKPAPYQEQKQ